ncbi:MAG: 30S ribosome-binding factor RbfA [Bacillota bacterium]
MTARSQRVAEAIKEEISDILQNDMKDPRIGFASVVRVQVSPDLRAAKVHVSVLGDEEARRKTMAGLDSGTGFIRSELGKRLRLRHTPEVVFVLDDSIEHGVHISKLLMDLRRDQERE